MYRFGTKEYLEATVARFLRKIIDDWAGWLPATLWLYGPCPFHGCACVGSNERWREFLKLVAVLEPFRVGGPLRLEPYVTMGGDGRHILAVKEDMNGWTYVVGAAGDLDEKFGSRAFEDQYMPPPAPVKKYV